MKLAEHMRLHPVLRGMQEPYRYEREVEDFLRWSPHVRNPNYRKEGRLSPDELVELQKTSRATATRRRGSVRRRRACRPGGGRRSRRPRRSRR